MAAKAVVCFLIAVFIDNSNIYRYLSDFGSHLNIRFDAVSGGIYNQDMNLIRCDKCKNPKREKHSSLDKKSKWIDLGIRGNGEWLNFDLCGKCSNNLVKYIKRYIGIKETGK